MKGKFSSFAELGKAMNIKAPAKKPAAPGERKCENCGKPMRYISGTNVWVCDFARIEDGETKNGVKCQVFTRCGHFETADS